MSEFYIDGTYGRAILKQASAAIMQNIGFSCAKESCVNVLAEIMEDYIVKLSRVTKTYTEHAGRTVPNLADAELAFNRGDVNIKELAVYMESVASFTLPFTVPSFPVVAYRQDKSPSKNSIEFNESLDQEEFKRQEHKRREEIRSQFPNYQLILAEQKDLACDDGVHNETVDSLSSGVMALCSPTEFWAKPKKPKKGKKNKIKKIKKEKRRENEENYDEQGNLVGSQHRSEGSDHAKFVVMSNEGTRIRLKRLTC